MERALDAHHDREEGEEEHGRRRRERAAPARRDEEQHAPEDEGGRDRRDVAFHVELVEGSDAVRASQQIGADDPRRRDEEHEDPGDASEAAESAFDARAAFELSELTHVACASFAPRAR